MVSIAVQADGNIVIAGEAFPSGANGDPQFAIVRLLGGDGGGTPPTISVADANVVEGDAGSVLMSFTLTLSSPSPGGIGVTAQTDLGSAAPNVDYTPTGAFLTFDQGVSSVAFQVPVIGDVAVEGGETFLVQLSDAAGATIADGTAVGTIIDDDAGVPPEEVQPVPTLDLLALWLLTALCAAVAFLTLRRG
jgi:hypothetical protein